MGCHWSYCDKVQLCHLLRQYNPDLCFVLPEDHDRLTAKMDNETLWVLKRSSPELFLHVGSGIQYVKDLSSVDTSDGTYMVQPYYPPLLTYLHRKAEIKIYLAVTSVYPLRLYAHKSTPIVLSPVRFKGLNYTDRCQHLTNVNYRQLGCPIDMDPTLQVLHLNEYAKQSGFDAKAFMASALELLAFVIVHAQPQIQEHYVNQGIRDSGASCFSFMRADLGFSESAKPILFEINETPWLGGSGQFLQDKNQMQRELFTMIGLDQPPLSVEDRAAYEAAHMGDWQLIS